MNLFLINFQLKANSSDHMSEIIIVKIISNFQDTTQDKTMRNGFIGSGMQIPTIKSVNEGISAYRNVPIKCLCIGAEISISI